jgi:hypothetical protein
MGTAGNKGDRGVKVTTRLSLVSECNCNVINLYGFKGVNNDSTTFSNNKIHKSSCLLGYDSV